MTKLCGISTKHIQAICSKDEMKTFTKLEPVETKNLVLISIQDPNDDENLDEYHSKFKDVLSVKFWDIRESYIEGSKTFNIISDKTSNEIREFINNNLDEKFFIHCQAGVSRSASIGLVIEYLKGLDIDNSEIKSHWRYDYNEVVFDKIVESGVKPKLDDIIDNNIPSLNKYKNSKSYQLVSSLFNTKYNINPYQYDTNMTNSTGWIKKISNKQNPKFRGKIKTTKKNKSKKTKQSRKGNRK